MLTASSSGKTAGAATSSVSIEEVERRMAQIRGVEGHEDEYVYLVSLIAKLEKKAGGD